MRELAKLEVVEAELAELEVVEYVENGRAAAPGWNIAVSSWNRSSDLIEFFALENL